MMAFFIVGNVQVCVLVDDIANFLGVINRRVV